MLKFFSIPGDYFINKYHLFVELVFFCFLFGILALGRYFSHLHINVLSFPLYTREIVLLLSLPLIILSLKDIFRLPKAFITVLFVYFLYGCFYLFLGLINKNLLALRDIVLCIYILFMPLTLIVFSKKRNLIFFLFILVASNIIAIVILRAGIFRIFPWPILSDVINETKILNAGFYFGMTVSFLIPFFSFVKKWTFKLLILLLLSLNFYMFIIFSKRGFWVACFALIIYFVFTLKSKFIKFVLFFVPFFILFGSFLFYLDIGFDKNSEWRKNFQSEVSSFEGFVEENLNLNNTTDIGVYKKIPEYKNITWRISIWKQSIKFGLRSPLYGNGFGVYPKYIISGRLRPVPQITDINSKLTAAHNHLITIFYKMGFLGLGLFTYLNIFVLIYCFFYLKNCKNEFRKCFLIASLGAFIFWHTAALFLTLIDSSPTSIFLWILIGLIFATIEADKKYIRNEARN